MTVAARVASSARSTTVELSDLGSGAVVRSASVDHPAITSWSDGVDPAAWWTGFERCWSELGDPQVGSLSVTAEHGVVVLDAGHDVVRPALVGVGADTEPDAGWLTKQLPDGAAAWVDAVGAAPTAAHTISVL
jgi:sugar (pentulose or hexulose) kinase